ncbi:MAG: YcxB family protein [Sphingomonas sp.]|uniref:YcxB family protein n=1 Tax=Sphingomonas sp. TaxID=28214 RepID=UPI002635204C|nr:YcxB family protein [Sphingomonas sp.]MDK2767862.1 YcxB family protein [Sphingomonas sp.]
MRSDVHYFSVADIAPIRRLLGKLARPSLRSVAILVTITASLGLLALVVGEAKLVAIPGVAVAIATVAWLTPSLSRRTLEQWIDQHALCAPFTAWDDVEIRHGGCIHGTDSVFPWKSIRAAIASPDYIILLSRCGPLIVPQRALDAQRAADLLRQLATNGIAVRLAD